MAPAKEKKNADTSLGFRVSFAERWHFPVANPLFTWSAVAIDSFWLPKVSLSSNQISQSAVSVDLMTLKSGKPPELGLWVDRVQRKCTSASVHQRHCVCVFWWIESIGRWRSSFSFFFLPPPPCPPPTPSHPPPRALQNEKQVNHVIEQGHYLLWAQIAWRLEQWLFLRLVISTYSCVKEVPTKTRPR